MRRNARRGWTLLVLLALSVFFGSSGLKQATAQRVDPGGAPPAGSGPVDYNGFVRVIDGDTVELHINGRQVGVALHGINAPQGNTPCGIEATAALQALVKGGLHLEEDPTDAFDSLHRRLYYAVTADGRSVTEELVKAGVAHASGKGKEATTLAGVEAKVHQARGGCLNGGAAIAVPKAAPRLSYASASQTTLPAGFSQDVVVSGLTRATSLAYLPDGRILVAEKSGTVRVVKNGVLLPAPLIDIHDHVNDYWDHGIINVAVDPHFAQNGYVYLYYTYENDPTKYNGTKTARLSRVTVSGDVAAPTETLILGSVVGATCVGLPVNTDCISSDGPGHSAGAIHFASDGTMFVTVGDSASFNVVDDLALRAQNLDSLNGKLLHITATGQGIATNPFWTGDPSAVRSKVWAYGLRNSYRFTLRPSDGMPYVGDVGWNTWEKVSTEPAGANLGWPCYEGAGQQAGYAPKPTCQALYTAGTFRPPLVTYNHNGNGMAITGGTFYTGTAFPAKYQGAYFYGDYAYGTISTLRTDASDNLVANSKAQFATYADGPVDFAMAPDGTLVYLAINTGEIRRLRYNGVLTPPVAAAAANPASGTLPLAVQFSSQGSSDPGGGALTYLWDFGDKSATVTTANPTHTYTAAGAYTATLTVTTSGGATSTATAKVNAGVSAPAATISSPSSSLTFKVGDVVSYAGSATDPKDGQIPPSGLAWQIILHHCPGGSCHTHYFGNGTGAGGSFTVPDHGDQIYFEIQLTATNSAGLTNTTSVSIQPKTVALNLTTVPAGLQAVYSGTAVTTPFTQNVTIGSTHTIGVASPQGSNTFTSWSDGGAQQHDVVAGTAATTYTASFTGPPVVAVSGLSPNSGPVAGGTRVTVSGSGFSTAAGGTAIKFGAKAATAVSCASTTQCTATSPAGAGGSVDVTATVGGQTSAAVAADGFSYGPCTASRASFNPGSPHAPGGTITITAGATCGGTPQYRFYLQPPGGQWAVAQDYGASNSYSWNTAGLAEGTYWLGLWVRNAGSQADWESYTYVPFVLDSTPCSNARFAKSPASPQQAGTTVTWTASATCTGTAQYRFYLQAPGGNYNLVQDYSTSNTYSWNTTGLKPGTYWMNLWVRKTGFNGDWETYVYDSFTITQSVQAAPCTASNVGLNPASPHASGGTITATATATCGGTPEYRFLLQAPGGNYNVVQEYGASSSYSWNTAGLADGTYWFGLWVRNTGSQAGWESYAYVPYILDSSPCSNAYVATSPASPQRAGATVTWTASATCTGTAQYRFYLQAPGGNYNLVQDYSTSNTFSWNTAGLAPGTYWVNLWVRKTGFNGDWESYDYESFTIQ